LLHLASAASAFAVASAAAAAIAIPLHLLGSCISCTAACCLRCGWRICFVVASAVLPLRLIQLICFFVLVVRCIWLQLRLPLWLHQLLLLLCIDSLHLLCSCISCCCCYCAFAGLHLLLLLHRLLLLLLRLIQLNLLCTSFAAFASAASALSCDRLSAAVHLHCLAASALLLHPLLLLLLRLIRLRLPW
jgi:hypothetical protein